MEMTRNRRSGRLLPLLVAIALAASPMLVAAPANAQEVDAPASTVETSAGGDSGEASFKDGPQIVGGQPAGVGEYPWFAALRRTNGGRFCGGSLIRPLWVLTAAHCVTDDAGQYDITAAGLQVVIGRTTYSNTAQGVQHNVSQIIKHPTWNGLAPDGYDAALVKLSTPSAANPVLLAEAHESFLYDPGDNAVAIGHGRTTEGGTSSDALLEVDLPIQSDAAMSASTSYGTRFKGATMIGAGSMAGGKDTCQGDSGGPLITGTTSGGTRRLIGVTSWGDGCARPNKPGIYAQVFSNPLRQWVESNARVVYGYVWANQSTTASYTPATTWNFNSQGGPNTIRRLGTGYYEVRFPNLGVLGGTVDVSAYSTDNLASCKVQSWIRSGGSQFVYIRCFHASGRAVDSRFSAAYTRPYHFNTRPNDFAHVWANSPSSPSYTPNGLYSFNSLGFANTITRSSAGVYRVLLPELNGSTSSAGLGGTAKVTAYGSDSNTCRVSSWGNTGSSSEHGVVFVRCFNNAGTPTDSTFTMSFTNRTLSILGVRNVARAYAFGNSPTSASYNPTPAYAFSSGGGTVSITRSAVGRYRVLFPGLASVAGNAQATAYGATTNAHECKVGSWGSTSGTTKYVDVICQNTAGSAVDTHFTVQFAG